MPKYRPTGSRLESARCSAGLTLAAVAAAVTRDTRSVRRWESGQTRPSRNVLLTLAQLYGTDVHQLAGV